MTRVAIVGAGLAGLVLAKQLRGKAEVRVFEKSRGVGGRMATRYHGDFEFDHGTQFFTARSPEFRSFLEPFTKEGIVANWKGRFAEIEGNRIVSERQWDDAYPHYVGAPRMNSIGKFLARDTDVQLQTTVSRIERMRHTWVLSGDKGKLGEFDWVVLAAPAAQTAALAKDVPALAETSAAAKLQPCFALMLGFDDAPEMPWQAALVRDADISWVSTNSSKPGRGAQVTTVVHSTNAWAAANFYDDAADVQSHLLETISKVLGRDVSAATVVDLQRWRYANIEAREGPACYFDVDKKIAACGDWFIRGRVEAAFTSANRLAAKLESVL